MNVKHSHFLQLNTFLEQKPMTYIDDTTAPVGDLNFPSVTICNINRVLFVTSIIHYSESHS